MIHLAMTLCWCASLAATVRLIETGHEWFAVAVLILTCGLSFTHKPNL